MAVEFRYRVAEVTDRDRIVDFLFDNFFREEPCTQALGLTRDEMQEIYEEIVDRCLGFPFSTVVTSETGEMAGVILYSVWRREDNVADADLQLGEFREKLQKFIEMLNAAHDDFWTRAPPITRAVLHMEMSSVAKKFQRRGIATSMVTAQLKDPALLEAFHVDGIISETSSFANQQVLGKMGFKTLKTIDYETIKDSEGNSIIKTADGSTRLQLDFKLISDLLL